MHLLLIVCAAFYITDLIHAAPAVENYPTVTTDALDKEVFRMPRTLKVRDRIEITGQMTEGKERITINLVKGSKDDKPDFTNVGCQVKLEFPSKTSNNDRVTINTIVNGITKEVDEDMQPSKVFLGNSFTITFIMTGENKIELDIDELNTDNDCRMEYGIDMIKFLTVGGDLDKIQSLNFIM